MMSTFGYTALAVREQFAAHIETVSRQHQADLRHGSGWVELPGALALKYRAAAQDWGWQWIFPATRIYVDRQTGQRRRHHLHESVVQRAVKEAVRAAGLTKPATCHSRAQPRVERRPEPRRSHVPVVISIHDERRCATLLGVAVYPDGTSERRAPSAWKAKTSNPVRSALIRIHRPMYADNAVQDR